MASMMDSIEERPSTAVSTFNPLQSYHSHMYTSVQKQQRQRNKEKSSQEKQEKAKRRASKHVPAVTDTDPTQLKRKSSRLGLFGIFNRTKSSDIDVAGDALPTPLEGEEDERYRPVLDGETESSSPRLLVPDESLKSVPAQASNIPMRHRASRRALKTKESFTRDLTMKKASIWEPPPLFQAYPQSVKHATLQAPSLPAETILRLNHEKQENNASRPDSSDDPRNRKKQKEKKLKKSSALEAMSKRDWTEKVYLLVTEGYLLQYTGHGAHDRPPEKIMPLSKNSAAFASDAIPGKHYVLQISQISDEDGTVDPEISKSMLKKAGLRNEMKHSASTFLLVLNDPQEMNTWLIAVRKEIEALGGKEYRPEVFGTDGLEENNATQPVQQMQRIPSQRYLVKREPHKFSQNASKPPAEVTFVNSGLASPSAIEAAATEALASSTANRYSSSTRDPISSPYISDTTASIDQIHLDRLRESPRQSYASTDQKTASTSRCSSMERSPVTEGSDATFEVRALSSRRGSANPGIHEAPMHQEREETNDRELDQPTPTPMSRPRSAVTTPTTIRAASPATPNFSVPTFSKRFSMNNSSPAPSVTTQTPPPTLAETEDHISQPKSAIDEDEESNDRNSLVGEMLFRPPLTSRASARTSVPTQQGIRAGPPSRSSDPRSTGEGELRFSRRHSSLEYARGISPVPRSRHSPSPHPPPSTALPPIPDRLVPNLASLTPPPTGPLPPVPSAGRPRASLLPSPTIPPPAVSSNAASSEIPSPRPPNGTSIVDTGTPGKAPRPDGMQVRQTTQSPPEEQPIPAEKNDVAPPQSLSDTIVASPAPSPPKPTREPPLPPTQSPPKVLSRKSMPRLLGRSPPPISKPLSSAAKPTLPASGQQDHTAPSPFIPPIKVRERQSRSSLDGPWNANYAAAKKTGLDAGVE